MIAQFSQSLQNNPVIRAVLDNSNWMIAEQGARLLIGFTVGVWLARYLGPHDFGVFASTLAYIMIFQVLAVFGLHKVIVSELVKGNFPEAVLLGTAAFLRTLFGFVAAALAVGMSYLFDFGESDAKTYILVLSIILTINAYEVLDLWFQSRHRAKYAAIANGLTALVAAGIKVIFILYELPLMAFVAVQSAEAFLKAATLVAFYFFLQHERPGLWRIELSVARKLVPIGLPLLFTSAMVAIYMRIDQVMLAELQGPENAGIYAVAVRLVQIWTFIPTILSTTVLPFVIQASLQDRKAFDAVLKIYFSAMVFASYAVAVPLAIGSRVIVDGLFGEVYADATWPLVILAAGLPLVALGVARTSYLLARAHYRLYALSVFAGCAINVALNIALIPKYGEIGAAVATVASYAVASVGSSFLLPSLRGIGLMQVRALLFPRIRYADIEELRAIQIKNG